MEERETHLEEEDVYYIITCYKEGRDYPNYLANFEMDINKGMMIQASIYDAIKFDWTMPAALFMKKAEETFGVRGYTFELSMISKNVFGKGITRFIYKGL